MNARLKTALNRAWNEPRHFFFWLALLSALGLVVFVVGQVLMTYELQKTSLGLLLGFLELACVFGFVVGVPAFVLSWIPPLRRLFAWLLARRFLVLGAFITLIALVYAVENWRGRRAWQDFKREREAKGERFELAAYVPPPVPADQNFFETPLWEDLHFVGTNGSVAWQDPDREGKIVFSIYGPDGNKAPGTVGWMKGLHVDLAAWQGFYRGNSNSPPEVAPVAGSDAAAREAFRRRYGLETKAPNPPTNYFPVAKEAQTPAADVLLALSRFETNRQLLIASIDRPQARFWVNYDAGYAMLLPHLSRVKGTVQFLSLHANAALKSGDTAMALQDVTLALRLQDNVRQEPALISHLVRIAVLQIALQPVWEGLSDHQWSAADLSKIENELTKLDFLADYQSAMRGERACNLWGVDYMRKAGFDGWAELADPNTSAGGTGVGQCLARAMCKLIPSGWYDQNKLSISRNHDRYILPSVDRETRIVSPAVAQQAQSALASQGIRIYDVFSRMLMPAVAGAVSKFARAQTSVDLALVACALERYRIANGQFPDTLPALVPKFMSKLPHDVINGEPLKYHRTADGRFVLYSVGWNGTDDGGKVGLNQSGNVDIKTGDWVWSYSGS
jgi:hypothetical protein